MAENSTVPLARDTPAAAAEPIIKLAVLAVGGQGGGVLTDWITEAAERSGHVAQSTSVAGVAQRTGATIYYVEMCRDVGRRPVFALSPAPGDVDILVAAEMMEAGRAIMRGFVTPDRTTLIASSHRIEAVSEKIEPGDGRASSDAVRAAAVAASRRFVAFDMQKIAADAGSVISAALLGALAGSGALPFPRESYEAAITGSGRAADASLRAFADAFETAGTTGAAEPAEAAPRRATAAPTAVLGPARLLQRWQMLEARLEAYPGSVRDMAGRGLRKVVDYQDLDYGRDYLDLLEQALAEDGAERGHLLSLAAAKHLANAMCYDDIIRVADLKTRSRRAARVRREAGGDDAAMLRVTEYFHPRIEEFCGTLPARFGRYIEARPKLAGFLDRRVNRGRHVRSDSLAGFTLLWLIGGLRRWRRKLLRHEFEAAHLRRWYGAALRRASSDYGLAVEILECRRLIKGYSDTHARGISKFDRVLSGLDLVEGRADAAAWMRRLREAALKDEKGDMLDGALKTVASLVETEPRPA